MRTLLFCTKKANFSSYPLPTSSLVLELEMFPTPLSSGPLGQGNLFEDLLLLWVEGLAVVEAFVGRRKFCIMRRLHLLILLLVLPPDASGAGCKDVLDKVCGVLGSILGLC